MHIKGEKNFLTDLKPCAYEHVIYDNGHKGKIIDKEKLQYSRFSSLSDLILVEDLTRNLISISQLCDQGFNANFLKDRCLVTTSDKTLSL